MPQKCGDFEMRDMHYGFLVHIDVLVVCYCYYSGKQKSRGRVMSYLTTSDKVFNPNLAGKRFNGDSLTFWN